MKIISKIFAFVFLLQFGFPLLAGDGGYAGAFLRYGVGARPISLGDSYVSIAHDGYAPYYNPALMPFLKQNQISLSYAFMTLDRVFNYAAYCQNLRPSAGVGVAWIHAGVNNITGRDFSGRETGEFSTSEDVFYLSFANRFFGNVAFGLNFKIHRIQLQDLTGSGLGFDFAVAYFPGDKFSFGLIIKDISSSYSYNTQKIFDRGGTYTDKFPQIVKAGFAYRVSGQLLITTDFEASDRNDQSIHVGAEYLWKDRMSLRAGLNDGQFSAGIGLRYAFLGKTDTDLNYTYQGDVAGEGLTHIFGWNFQF